ncbi:sirohydrochlorin chelatase [Oceanicella actignis]|uniref:Sirohydrochlorin ferrochelatase n=1 Tax=Oceanicella actignis TaxID=1189325 RepID=A0A1M7THB6_9RHOB|nr:CbiX/SirB N-terminal domain-containing protein [Oceanicella actignis]SET59093.1 Sirohydrochlorin ferrochelatase [Oceanicella actignis]SHN70105.1 Sirohydrochlorin ferrochelatase [Oceanicella actignis]
MNAPALSPPAVALLIAHGSPSQPERAEAVFADIASRAEALAAPTRIISATLAAPGALARALTEAGALAGPGAEAAALPFFMTDGWFASDELPRRLAEAARACAGAPRLRLLPPFGAEPELVEIGAARARAGALAAGFDPAEATLVVAAHGSPSDPRPGAAARDWARRVRRLAGFGALRVGFADEAPSLAEALRVRGPAVCLPFFIGHAGHAERDLPEAAQEARYAGVMLDPIGADPETPRLIAQALARATPRPSP